ncbi:hypothetical protein pdul_cds_497 [Pandoravirus dulcis]|uniref:Uncharacterized protein n=1 Tax=Pandoravirus dulcis TaxID=1349409 RepID=A0A291AUA8_9VIRU|nr:hypothetical protein pdul_cds_497 [Pandoravirus dulcis]ATE82516.1 hypothetical protein pdul_cds_497 [Pandoravirus dulcis]
MPKALMAIRSAPATRPPLVTLLTNTSDQMQRPAPASCVASLDPHKQPTSDRAEARAARILAKAEALATMRPTKEESDALFAEWEKTVEAGGGPISR